MTLWCVFRSPLIMGGNLTRLDDWTKSLLTNSEVLAVDQHGSKEHQTLAGQNAAVWISSAADGAHYVAVFNLGEETRDLTWGWKEVGLPEGTYTLRDLWLHKDMGEADKLQVQVAKHGAVLLRVEAK